MSKITRTIKSNEVAYRTVKNGALSDEVKTIQVMGNTPLSRLPVRPKT